MTTPPVLVRDATPAQKVTPPHRMILVTLGVQHGLPDVQALTPHFDKSTDWYRYAPNCWLLWTGGDAPSWCKYLKSVLPTDQYVFAAELKQDGSISGWLPAGAWEWLNKYMPGFQVDNP